MSDDKAKAGKPSQVMDVSHPGKTAPTGNSKSVIVTHRAVIQDPMVKGANEKASDSMPAKRTAPILKPADSKAADTPPPLKAPIPEAITQPKSEAEPVADTAATSEAEQPAETADAQAAPEATSAPTTVAHKELQITPPAGATAASVPKKPIEVAEADPKTADADEAESEQDAHVRDMDKADEIGETSKDGKTAKAVPTTEEVEAEQAKADAALQKLVDSKKYFLPINTLENRRTKRFVMLGILLSIVLIAAWVDVALDAGLISINGLKPLTHFFSS